VTIRLVARWPDHEATLEFPDDGSAVTIGSSRRNAFVVRAPGVSREHARAEVTPGGRVLVIDAGSKNGILLEGEAVDSVELVPGISVRLGEATLAIESDRSPDKLAIALRPSSAPSGISFATESVEASTRTWEALRWASEAPMAGEPAGAAERRGLLRRAMEVLRADALAICVVDAAGAVAILELAGKLPTEPSLAEVLALRPHEQTQFVIQPATESQVLVAWAADGFADRAFTRDFLRYASRVHLGASETQARPLAANALTIPPGIIAGRSPGMQALYEQIRRVAHADTILISGENGSGKESVARMLHSNGWSKAGPFKTQNCAAISGTLFEAELFGIVKGAATEVRARPGLFREADKGSLLLDEISEIPLPMQAKLLRAVQEREVQPVGSTITHPVRLRLIATTNRNLPEMVSGGTFRADLYHRLHKVELHVPPLRERPEDLADLVTSFLARESEIHRRHVRGVTEDALRMLQRYPWPGNVRELDGEITRAVLACPIGGSIRPEHLSVAAPDHASAVTDLNGSRAAADRSALSRALADTKNNVTATARLLGVSRKTVYDLMRRYGFAFRSPRK
jgi:DNA-binding NtrC family response regulator